MAITYANFIDDQKKKLEDEMMERAEDEAKEMVWNYIKNTVKGSLGK